MEEKKKYYTGLTDKEVSVSREQYGDNLLTPPRRESLWKLYFEKFEDPIIRILLIAAVLSLAIAFVHWQFAESIGIFCAIFLATGIGFWFEMDAHKKFNILNKVNDDTQVKVMRNGNACAVPKKDVVVGDVVLIEAGEEVPADGVLLESVALQVDESCLTGELVADKTTDAAQFDAEATYPSNHVLRGTMVRDGHAVFRVRCVGDATEFGKVAKQSTEMPSEETPLNQQLDKLAKLIGVVGFVLAILSFGARFVKDIAWGEVVYTSSQFYLLCAALVSIFLSGIKIWLPIVYDAFEFFGKEKEMPDAVKTRSWYVWLGAAAVLFAVLCGAGWLCGIHPLLLTSWVTIDQAATLLQYLMVSVALIVVAVPEGLPMSVTLSLALSMRKMLRTNNLVRKMHACETMGATTVICTDKTGTLTQNRMQVSDMFFCGLEKGLDDSRLSRIIKESIAVNTTAYLDYSDEKKITTLGNPTEGALLLWLHEQHEDYLAVRESFEITAQLSFSTERKYMATVGFSPELKQKVLYVKGAPEIVMGLCSSTGCAITPDEIQRQLTQYQNQAKRTLAFAYRFLDAGETTVLDGNAVGVQDMILLGVTAISDPIREDVPAAIAVCHDAGIQVKIVTGDTPGTAKEIGRQIGILSAAATDREVITGVEFGKMSDDEALQRIPDMKIMCRARPNDKQRLVTLLQRQGEIVAVTGDGTNDAPALNYAHVGLSMGSGTTVAKEASDITLIDDSFSSITNAVLWGRSVYRNIQRFILFQLTINVAALIIDFIGALSWGQLPLTVTQLLWINLIMDTFAAGALASLPPDKKVMREKPRNRNSFIVSKSMANIIFGTGISFVVILLGLLFFFERNDMFHTGEAGLSIKELTVFLTLFVMLQFWNMFNAKAFASGKSAFYQLRNSYGFILVALAILAGQILIVQYGGSVFRTCPLTLQEWLAIFGLTSAVLWIGELGRLWKKMIAASK
ncbi:MAG: calcium-translocating P-type ATPase, PMCA-type [Prevotellaceae bacterium]|jgi:Ca2+-transporting ATPase|nr:calcium-translocating P-type ATPase, PMCA-type [Prevotellaceae bacterium]